MTIELSRSLMVVAVLRFVSSGCCGRGCCGGRQVGLKGALNVVGAHIKTVGKKAARKNKENVIVCI